MAKKYVVENAKLNCQYGEQSWLLVPENRHIGIGGKMMANETDYKKTCCGSFGTCHSPYVFPDVTQKMHDILLDNQLTSLQQFSAMEVFPCQYEPGPQWMETKEDVYIAGYRALMEDSWTFCIFGLGMVTLNSVLLWNGYASIPWETKVSQELWDFGVYMEKNHPYLSNYFERGVYLFDEQTGANIDVSYMAGLSMVITDPPEGCWKLLTEEVFADEAMYNGYLEASRQESSENALEAMQKFLDYYASPEYNGSGRYTDYLEMPENYRTIYEEMYRQGSSMDRSYYEPGVPLDVYGDPEEMMKKQEKLLHWPEWSQEEKDLLILQSYLSDYVGEEEADAFVRKVCESAGREKGSWKE